MFYGDRIRGLREDHDISQTTIAEALHVAQTTYSDYENGRVRIPVDTLIQLAEYYDVDMNYICGITRERNSFPGKKTKR